MNEMERKRLGRLAVITAISLGGATIIYFSMRGWFKAMKADLARKEEKGVGKGDLTGKNQYIEDVDLEQEDIPKNVKGKNLEGKQVYAKLDEVNLRSSPVVDNGWLKNNKVGTVARGHLIGEVTESNRENDTFIWHTVVPSPPVQQDTGKNRVYVREDVIILDE